MLAHLHEMSGALRSNIDAYVTNIDGFSHTFEPSLDLDDDETRERIAQAMLEERILGVVQEASVEEQAKRLLKEFAAANDGEDGEPTGADDQAPLDVTPPTDAEVEARIDAIRREMIRERMRLERFFEFCCVTESFMSLRMRTRQDIELIGNGYWEVLRNSNGDIVQFTYVPAFTVRLLPADKDPIEVEMPVKLTANTENTETVVRRFRRFLQISETRERTVIYFKEFGDPRVVSSKTGEVYETPELLAKAEGDTRPATEMIHFKVHNSRTPYGVPRWASELLGVLGNRNADEVNLAYFENRAIPPMILTVSGGRLAGDSATVFENYFKSQIRGKRHHHSVAIVEAEPPGLAGGMTNGTVKLDVIKLRDVQQDDAMFMGYREANVDAIGSVFRMPRLLRGDVRDFNRATAQTALDFAEMQVFAPLRAEFDFTINRQILADFGVRFWKFKSGTPDFSDPAEVLQNLQLAEKYLVPNEQREAAAGALGRELEKLDAAWARERPLAVTLAAIERKTNLVDVDGEALPEQEPPPPPEAKPLAGGPPGVDEGEEEQAKAIRKSVDERVRDLIELRDAADRLGFLSTKDMLDV